MGCEEGHSRRFESSCHFYRSGLQSPFDVNEFAEAAQRILDEVEDELGWMYETLHTDGKTKGRINYTVWSEVFTCPECSGEVVFLEEALDPISKRVAKAIKCPKCGATATKEQMDLCFESFFDHARNRTERRPIRVPVLINYNIGKSRYEKRPESSDLDLLGRIAQMAIPVGFPVSELPDCQMTRVGRMRTTNTLCNPSHVLAEAELKHSRSLFGIKANVQCQIAVFTK